ncbi:MAG: phosphatidate cytidylyltransferase [Candidatus Gastranaerophilales bacterium]|nr:phosphatidate cytidylyltransferase [Candidatus Gastranaerophilales bacterium]
MDNKNITRIITGTILGVIVLMSIIKGGWALFVITLLFILFATREYVAILKNKGFYPSIKVILFADIFFALLAYLNRFNMVSFAVTISSITAFIWVLFNGRQPYIANVATTILGFIYGGLFPLYLIFLRDIGSTPQYNYLLKTTGDCVGFGFVMLLFFAVLLTDTGCYYFGTKFGKHKLAPIISPNKTIEGSIGGTLSAIAVSLLIGHFINLAWYHCVIAGLLIALFSQIGDLCESLIKRDAGVKDSGNTLPGHGGFLDRTDSYVFTLPVLYYYFHYVVYDTNTMNALTAFVKGLW